MGLSSPIFPIGVLIALLIFASMTIVFVYGNLRLWQFGNYLKCYFPDRWKSIFDGGGYAFWDGTFIRYINSNEDNNDDAICRFKAQLNTCIKLFTRFSAILVIDMVFLALAAMVFHIGS